MDISVIIPAFNASRYIAETIRSVSAQTVPVSEIIVVDDGSTDDTGQVAKSAADNVTLLRQPNSGPSVARNKGLELAQGEVIAFLDSDDLWLPDKMEHQLKVMNVSDRVVGVASSYEDFDEETLSCRMFLVKDLNLQNYTPLDFVVSARVLPSSLIVNRRLVGNVKFPESIVGSEDLIYVGLVRTKGEIRSLEQVKVRRRRHDRQLTMRKGHHL